MHPNPQGPQVLANEALASIVFEAFGYHVPEWRCIEIGIQDLDIFKDLMMVGPGGPYFPKRGLHYGSRHLYDGDHTLLNWISAESERSLWNSSETLAISLLDLWASHDDERQCLYRRIPDSRSYIRFFIDNGHMFGGPFWANWNGKRRGHPQLLGKAIPSDDPAVLALINLFQIEIPKLLRRAESLIPKEWYTGTLGELFAVLLTRLSKLHDLIIEEEKFHEERRILWTTPRHPDARTAMPKGIVENLQNAM